MFLKAGVCFSAIMSDLAEMISNSDKVVIFGQCDDSHSDGKFISLH